MSDITMYAESVDVTASQTPGVLEVDLDGVDVSQLVHEVGADVLLSEIPREDIEEYLKDLDNED